MYLTDEIVSSERYESEIAIIKFNNDNKDYILSFSYPFGDIEIFDFHESKIYLSQTLAVNRFAVVNKLWVCLKLNSNDNDNKYIIGIVESENFPPVYFFYLKIVNFPSLDIANNEPEYYPIQKTESSDSASISCYDMLNNYLACFILNRSFKYTMIVYSYDLIEKQNEVLADGTSNGEYQKIFFKCVHFFDETGAFGYFTNDEIPTFVFQFKKYLSDTNLIKDSYDSFNELPISSYNFTRKYVTLYDMIKIEDKKIFFVATTFDRDKLYIFSIFNYYRDKFVERIYSINTKDLYDYTFSLMIKITLYKHFLVLGSNYKDPTGTDYSSLIFFSYPNTTDAFFNITDYLTLSNSIKIYNLMPD